MTHVPYINTSANTANPICARRACGPPPPARAKPNIFAGAQWPRAGTRTGNSGNKNIISTLCTEDVAGFATSVHNGYANNIILCDYIIVALYIYVALFSGYLPRYIVMSLLSRRIIVPNRKRVNRILEFFFFSASPRYRQIYTIPSAADFALSNSKDDYV